MRVALSVLVIPQDERALSPDMWGRATTSRRRKLLQGQTIRVQQHDGVSCLLHKPNDFYNPNSRPQARCADVPPLMGGTAAAGELGGRWAALRWGDQRISHS